MQSRLGVFAVLAGSCLLFAVRTSGAHAVEARSRPTAGALVGVVQDRHGDAVPGAKVVLIGEQGETLMETTSAASADGRLALGEFEIDQLPAGRYSVRAEENGAVSPIIRVPVTAFEDTRVRLHLDLGY